MKPARKPLDRVDRSILRALQSDGRISMRKLSEEVHLSGSAVHTRLKRLLEQRVILGFSARVDEQYADPGPLLFAQVVLDSLNPSAIDAFQASVRRLPQLLECHLIAGKIDFILKARCSDRDACEAFCAQLSALPNVRRLQARLVEQSFKAGPELTPVATAGSGELRT